MSTGRNCDFFQPNSVRMCRVED